MAAVEGEATSGGETHELRVRVTSRRKVIEYIDRYKDVLRKVLDGQTEVPEDKGREILQELLANFEAAVQENVLVNGKLWDEAPDDEESEAVDLESLLDDTIVETTRRRRSYPRRILQQVIHGLKAERRLMGLYEQSVRAQELSRDPQQDSRLLHRNNPSLRLFTGGLMSGLSAAAPLMVQQAVQVVQSIHTLQTQAEGLCQVLHMRPSPITMEIHREVLGQSDAGGGARRSRQPIKRAVEEAEEGDCYVPLRKRREETTSDVQEDLRPADQTEGDLV